MKIGILLAISVSMWFRSLEAERRRAAAVADRDYWRARACLLDRAMPPPPH